MEKKYKKRTMNWFTLHERDEYQDRSSQASANRHPVSLVHGERDSPSCFLLGLHKCSKRLAVMVVAVGWRCC